jgi:hypothetical protein
LGRLFSYSLYGAGINDDLVHALCALEVPKQLFALTAPGATTCTATSGKKWCVGYWKLARMRCVFKNSETFSLPPLSTG